MVSVSCSPPWAEDELDVLVELVELELDVEEEELELLDFAPPDAERK